MRLENGDVEAAPEETTDETCQKCGAPMVVKRGKFGKFLACSRYPECKYTQGIATGVLCPEDGGKLVERRSRYGKLFYSCANYPDCKYALWHKPVPEPCPQCNAPFLVEKFSKKTGPLRACMNKECHYKQSLPSESGHKGAHDVINEGLFLWYCLSLFNLPDINDNIFYLFIAVNEVLLRRERVSAQVLL